MMRREFDKVTTYPYGTNVFKICENEMLVKLKTKTNSRILLKSGNYSN